MNETIAKWYDTYSDSVNALSDDIWAHPETGLGTYYAAKATAEFLRRKGFSEVRELDAAMGGGTPNCVIAKWGSGKPVIGIIGEFDALPGLGQECVPYRSPIEGPGHGCGHNLMAASGASSAAALKAALETEGCAGTVIYYGCPAEETFEGKPLMMHNHLFDEADVALAWHPMDGQPSAFEASCTAVFNMIMHFKGRAAHAGNNAENGRSALDAAEITNVMVQYLREHVTPDVKMHYIYLSAGSAPNIVPDYASLNYFIRASRMDTCKEVLERVKKCARGAAMGTETEVSFEIKAASYDTLINFALNEATYEAALKVPEIEYTPEELQFARELAKNVLGHEVPPDHDLLPKTVKKPTGVVGYCGGSTEVGDVSYIMPTMQFWGHVRMTGVPGHHWNTTSLMRHSIGHKGSIYSGKVIAQTGYDLIKNPELVERAWEEHRRSMKDRKPYHCWLDDVRPDGHGI